MNWLVDAQVPAATNLQLRGVVLAVVEVTERHAEAAAAAEETSTEEVLVAQRVGPTRVAAARASEAVGADAAPATIATPTAETPATAKAGTPSGTLATLLYPCQVEADLVAVCLARGELLSCIHNATCLTQRESCTDGPTSESSAAYHGITAMKLSVFAVAVLAVVSVFSIADATADHPARPAVKTLAEAVEKVRESVVPDGVTLT
ncbi:unnamed protein product [Phytophthora fragariaefolia]|uniref:Unnamed protein product n=1 Tax=Phytophthora fragariaefolia TaxID=1490495 RepID=A0A9W7D5E1_9STRA|nr:unnamed protein product [Phytophthora fragariaefolia]